MKTAIYSAIVVILISCTSNKEASPPAPDPLKSETNGTPSLRSAEPVVVKTPVEKAIFEGPGKLLPRTLSDWSLSGVPRYFGPDNLYDLIDGGAEIYVEMGLIKMVTSDYRSSGKSGVTVTLEIYDMGTPLGAFGRMARFLNGQQDPSRAGEGLPPDMQAYGLIGDTDLLFWKGKYLVHLTVMDESPTATAESMAQTGKALLPLFAKAIWTAVTEASPLPKEVAAFPKEHLVSRTEAWEPKALVGMADLGPGFSARYANGEIRWTLFVTSEIDDPALLNARLKRIGNPSGGRKSWAVGAGKRISGYLADSEKWRPEEESLLAGQVKKLMEVYSISGQEAK